MLLIFYPVVFILTFFVSKDFLAIAFDSGGVTTGPMTVPFIMALGIGFSAVRSDKYAETDSFGLVSLCSIGPVLAVLLLGIIYHPQGGSYSETVIPDAETSVALWKLFESGIPHYMWFLVPGYALALVLTISVPKIFTAIAFDSGGVASGPMTATFLLPFAQGACEAVGGNVVTDAFGVVAMVAMTPLITIQILGVVYQYQERKKDKDEMLAEPVKVLPLEAYGDADIIEL